MTDSINSLAPRTGRTALILHTGTMSGPARSYAGRLPLTTAADERFVYSPEPGPAVELFRGESTIRVFKFGTLSVPNSPIGIVKSAIRNLVDLAAFVRAFRRDQIETVISATTYTPAAFVAARLLGLRVVVECGEILHQSNDSRRSKGVAARLLIRTIDRTADLVPCCSDAVKRQFRHSTNAVTVYPRIAPDSDVSGSTDIKSRTKAGGPVIVVVGSIGFSRGQDIAIQALTEIRKSYPQATLKLAGLPLGQTDREYEDTIRSQARSIGLSGAVEFLGHVSGIEALLGGADVVVNPCRFDEPFGRVAYEALAEGTPVVVSDAGANTELLSDGVDVLAVPRDDAPALARAILRLLDSPELGVELVANSRKVLKGIRPEVIDEIYARAVADIL